MADLPVFADVVIVGAGPAGLAAAAELKAQGVDSVLVLERAAVAGGVPRVCGHSPYGLREFRRLMTGGTYADRLIERAQKAGAEIVTSATVTHMCEGPALTVSTPDGLKSIKARAVLLATGVRETSRAGRLLGGTKPGGVMVTGALQNLVYSSGLRPFQNPVIIGTELVSFSALLTCRHLCIRPVAMIEGNTRITARNPSWMLAKAMGVPLLLQTKLKRIEGRTQVTGVVLDTPTGETRLECDGVITSGKFRPESTMARWSGLAIDDGSGGPVIDEGGRCSTPGYYAAGNVLRAVETAGWCWEEGRTIARTIAADLNSGFEAAAAPIAVSGGALKYVVPQVISGSGNAAHGRLQLRVNRAVSGRLSLRADGQNIASRQISSLPERRLFLPLPKPTHPIEVVLEES